jgi:hypothetical protein
VAKQEKDPKLGKLKLRDWLLTVVQRCPRYLLLLKDLEGVETDDSERSKVREVRALVEKSEIYIPFHLCFLIEFVYSNLFFKHISVGAFNDPLSTLLAT